jgi:hypothetical protein
MMRDFVPIIQAKCEDCGGAVNAKRNLMNTDYVVDTATAKVIWTHLHVEDWQGRPHEAKPTRDGRERLAAILLDRLK